MLDELSLSVSGTLESTMTETVLNPPRAAVGGTARVLPSYNLEILGQPQGFFISL